MRTGFKQTDIGTIPEDWDVVSLQDVGQILNGLTYRPENVSANGTLVLRSSNIQDGNLAYEDNVYVDMKLPEHVITERGDILVCVRNGSRPLIGKCALIDQEGAGAAFGAFMAVLRTEFSGYVFQQFQFKYVKQQINENLGATINQITNKNLKSFQIPLPRTRTEISAIAAVLSDVDELIAVLDKLIAKKRAVKTAVMQQLFTGKMRLPGFDKGKGYKHTEVGPIPDDWEIAKLDNLVEKVGSGITPTGGSKVYKSFGRPFVRSQNVGWGTLRLDDLAYIDEETHQSFAATEIQEDDVLLNITGASIGRSTVVSESIVGGNVNQHVCIIRTKEGALNPKFLNTFLLSADGQNQIDSFQAGGNRQGLNFGQIRSFKIRKPNLLNEQQAIAEVLSDMEAEIAAIEKRRDKTKAIKQGMMQELLTGRTRLI